MTRDRQRGRLYAWEDREVAPRDASTVAFADAQGMVDAIWAEAGLRWPPRVEALPAQARARLADASRLTLRLPREVPSWCLLHEIAHAMTTTHDDISDGHGPRFVGVYVGLLARYLRLDAAGLWASLRDRGIAVQEGATAMFLDA